jgi:hypothetical protein
VIQKPDDQASASILEAEVIEQADDLAHALAERAEQRGSQGRFGSEERHEFGPGKVNKGGTFDRGAVGEIAALQKERFSSDRFGRTSEVKNLFLAAGINAIEAEEAGMHDIETAAGSALVKKVFGFFESFENGNLGESFEGGAIDPLKEGGGFEGVFERCFSVRTKCMRHRFPIERID